MTGCWVKWCSSEAFTPLGSLLNISTPQSKGKGRKETNALSIPQTCLATPQQPSEIQGKSLKRHLSSCPPKSFDHSFSASRSESTGDEGALGVDDEVPGGMVLHGADCFMVSSLISAGVVCGKEVNLEDMAWHARDGGVETVNLHMVSNTWSWSFARLDGSCRSNG